MDSAISAFWQFSIEWIRKRTVRSIKEEGLEFEEVRNQLIKDLERIEKDITALRYVEYKAAVSLFCTAIDAQRNDLPRDEVKQYFSDADLSAREGFTVVNTFEDKVLMTKIRIMSMMYKHGYFNGNLAANELTFLESQCSKIFQELLETEYVTSAIRLEFKPASLFSGLFGAGDKQSSNNILREVYQMERMLRIYLNYKKPLEYPNEKKELLCNKRPYLVKRVMTDHTDGVRSLVVYEGVLYSGSHDKTIHEWLFHHKYNNISNDVITNNIIL